MAGPQLHVITHVDVVPPRAEEGTVLIRRYFVALRNSPGLVRSHLLQQVVKKNHFEFITVWESNECYEQHLMAAPTLEFRRLLYPMIGSPIDDRLHHQLD
ncbi:MAG TPA: antibiotic biosynthesis monooxygenase [Candidatus Acidoferrales bacterium]|nr:antibiotic biosynthesis monooxygenase [Candidatus Acidoferrales bacterium]